MLPPTSASTFFSLATAMSLLIPDKLDADETHDRLRQAMQRDLARDDPSIQEKAVAEQATPFPGINCRRKPDIGFAGPD
jgi:hypothetical protein